MKPSKMSLTDRERRAGIEKPTHDPRTERGLLGCMVLHTEAVYTALQKGVTKEHFYGIGRGLIFEAIVELYETLGVCDLITLQAQLAEMGALEDAGGLSALHGLFDEMPTWRGVPGYCDRLLDLHSRRIAQLRGQEGLSLLREGDGEAARAAFSDAAGTATASNALLSREHQLLELDREMEEEAETGVVGMPTGYLQLNRMIGGFVRGRSYVIAGRTSEGKTSVALWCALQVARGLDPVHVFSFEMRHLDCNRRLLSLLAGVPLPRGALRRLSADQLEAVRSARRMLADLPIHVDERALSLTQVVAEARRRKGKVGLFVIDHARLCPVPGADTEYAQVTRVSGACKRDIAIGCDAAVLLVAQVNREGVKSGAIAMHHLQSSGALEQDADGVMILTRNSYGKPVRRGDAPDYGAKLTVAKNRHGRGGVIDLEWRPRLMRFDEPLAGGGDDEP